MSGRAASPRNDTEARGELDRLYASLPRVECKRRCARSCGPILMSRVEWERIIERLGYEPKGDLSGIVATWDCPMLSADRLCNVYDIRPLICRLWGVVTAMRCPWGCVPDRWLSDADSRQVLAHVDRIGA